MVASDLARIVRKLTDSQQASEVDTIGHSWTGLKDVSTCCHSSPLDAFCCKKCNPVPARTLSSCTGTTAKWLPSYKSDKTLRNIVIENADAILDAMHNYESSPIHKKHMRSYGECSEFDFLTTPTAPECPPQSTLPMLLPRSRSRAAIAKTEEFEIQTPTSMVTDAAEVNTLLPCLTGAGIKTEEFELQTPTSVATDVASMKFNTLPHIPLRSTTAEQWLPSYTSDGTLKKMVLDDADAIFGALHSDMFWDADGKDCDSMDSGPENIQLLTPMSLTTDLAPVMFGSRELGDFDDSSIFQVEDDQWEVDTCPRQDPIAACVRIGQGCVKMPCKAGPGQSCSADGELHASHSGVVFSTDARHKFLKMWNWLSCRDEFVRSPVRISM